MPSGAPKELYRTLNRTVTGAERDLGAIEMPIGGGGSLGAATYDYRAKAAEAQAESIMKSTGKEVKGYQREITQANKDVERWDAKVAKEIAKEETAVLTGAFENVGEGIAITNINTQDQIAGLRGEMGTFFEGILAGLTGVSTSVQDIPLEDAFNIDGLIQGFGEEQENSVKSIDDMKETLNSTLDSQSERIKNMIPSEFMGVQNKALAAIEKVRDISDKGLGFADRQKTLAENNIANIQVLKDKTIESGRDTAMKLQDVVSNVRPLDSSIKNTASQVGGLGSKITDVRSSVNGLTNPLNQIPGKLSGIPSSVNSVSQELKKIPGPLNKVDRSISGVPK